MSSPELWSTSTATAIPKRAITQPLASGLAAAVASHLDRVAVLVNRRAELDGHLLGVLAPPAAAAAEFDLHDRDLEPGLAIKRPSSHHVQLHRHLLHRELDGLPSALLHGGDQISRSASMASSSPMPGTPGSSSATSVSPQMPPHRPASGRAPASPPPHDGASVAPVRGERGSRSRLRRPGRAAAAGFGHGAAGRLAKGLDSTLTPTRPRITGLVTAGQSNPGDRGRFEHQRQDRRDQPHPHLQAASTWHAATQLRQGPPSSKAGAGAADSSHDATS